MYPKQKALESYLKDNNIDVDVDMSIVGNLEMVCGATLDALQNNTKLPRSITLTGDNKEKFNLN